MSSSAPLDDEDFEGSGGGFGDDSEEGNVYRSSGGSVPVSCHPPEGDPAQVTEPAWRTSPGRMLFWKCVVKNRPF